MARDPLPPDQDWPPPPGYWSLPLPDGPGVVEVIVDERGGGMHFTCTECGLNDDFYCDLCAYHFALRHSYGDHRVEDEIPPGDRHKPQPQH